MKIETKFNVGDKVWFMDRNRCFSSQVKGERVYSVDGEYMRNSKRTEIDYELEGYGTHEECNLYRTKQELLDSL